MKYRTALRQALSFSAPWIDWKLYRFSYVMVCITYLAANISILISIILMDRTSLILFALGLLLGALSAHMEARVRQDYAAINCCDEMYP